MASREPYAQLAALMPPTRESPWLAIGTLFYGEGRSALAIWRSRDAVTWANHFAGPVEHIKVKGAARQGERLVIVGEDRLGPEMSRAEIWVARGDSPPERVPLTPAVEGRTAGTMTAVSGGEALGRGFLVAGAVEHRPALWQSPDGENWARVDAAEELINKDKGKSSITTVLNTVHGALVLGRKAGGIAVWYADAEGWREGTFAGDPSRDHPNAITTTPTGFLAAGYTLDSDEAHPTTWTSSDRRTWLSSTSSFDIPRKPISDTWGIAAAAVARSTSGWVASGGGPSAKRAWTSRNGTRWEDLPLPKPIDGANDFDIDLLATSGDTALFGSTGMNRPRLLLWSSGRWSEVSSLSGAIPAPQPGAYNTGVVVAPTGLLAWANLDTSGPRIENENGRVEWWRSADGSRWERLPSSAAFDLGYVQGATVMADGIVAVGGTIYSLPGLTQPQNLEHRAWVSANGTEWKRLDPGIDENHGNRGLAGVVHRGDLQVAVGTVSREGQVGTFLVRRGLQEPWHKVMGVPGTTDTDRVFANDVCTNDLGFVAVGSASQGRIWFSADGETWQQVVAADLSDSSLMLWACGSTAAGFVAIGQRSSGSAAAFTSANGRDWNEVKSTALTGSASFFHAFNLATEGQDAVIVGSATEHGSTMPALWRSSDSGQTWTRLRLPARTFSGLYEGRVTNAAIRKGVLYVGGVIDDEPVIWWAPLAEADTRL